MNWGRGNEKGSNFHSYLFGMLISGVSGEESINNSPSLKKQVYTNCVLGVDYIVHMYTIAGAGFVDESYIAKYGSIISKDDRD